MQDDRVIELDPIKYLIDEAVGIIEKDTPRFSMAKRAYKFDTIEQLKRGVNKYVANGYFVWALVVHKRCVTITTPLTAKADASYNPFRFHGETRAN